jgi:hypothetical protein
MSGTRILGILLVIIGGVFMAGAAETYTYEQTTIETMPGVNVEGVQILQPVYNEVTTTPYQNYTLPLILGGIVLFIVGFVLIFYLYRKLMPQGQPQI